MRLRPDGVLERRRVGALLLPHVLPVVPGTLAPGGRALDRGADVIARIGERVELVSVAEHRGGDRAVVVPAQVVLVELDAVRVGLELQPHRRRPAVQRDLDKTSALVRVDPPSLQGARLRDAGPRQRAQRRSGQRTAPRLETHH
jgi:hypothetical protein